MRKFQLWILFVCTITVTFLSGFFLTGVLAYLSVRLNLLSIDRPIPLLPLAGTVIAASVFSLSLSLTAAHNFFAPIRQLIQAQNAVAQGDFSIRLPENARWRDIRDMNLNFNRMVKELNSMELLQSDFIQNASHELKTPLAAIQGYASLLSDSPLNQEQKQYLDRILESSRRLTTLTGNILLLSKLENQQIAPERQFFSLDEQIRCCILSLESLWSEKNMVLEVDLEEVRYFGVPDLLAQVWINLLSNAVKYTPAGGRIAVNLLKIPDALQITVEDTGIGMSEETQKHVFDKFYQGDKSRSSGGNGLGLALVRRILTLCGGEILIKSEVGSGTQMIVRLPEASPPYHDP